MIDFSAFDCFADTLKIDDDANYQWRIARRPEGNVQPEDYEWAVSEIPEPGEGEVLLKTHYLGLAPLMRMYMAGLDPIGRRRAANWRLDPRAGRLASDRVATPRLA